MDRLHVAVVFGGKSSEYEVSLRSGYSIIENLDQSKYDVKYFGITKNGEWKLFEGDVQEIPNGSWCRSEKLRDIRIDLSGEKGKFIAASRSGEEEIPVDLLFPALHGKNGEDGTVQGLFELMGLPYVGCGVCASAACMDKEYTHIILERSGIAMAKWICSTDSLLTRFDQLEKKVEKELTYPVFVKPANAGSSVGVSKATNAASLRSALETAFKEDGKVLIEQEVRGREVECAVLGDAEAPFASIVGEIAPEHEFYDYHAKYIAQSTKLYIPARIEEGPSQKVREIAARAFAAMNCFGLSRVDFFVDGETVILNEINTLPGFTSISMYSKLLVASGIPYSVILDRLIALGLSRKC